MHSSLTAVVLCILAQAAAACESAGPQDFHTRKGAEVIMTSTAKPRSAPAAVQGGELIKTAAAGTRDIPGEPRPAALVVRTAPDPLKGDKEPRSESAMLLAALALMSAIALRRYGGSRQ